MHKEWLALKYAQDWTFLDGDEPAGDYIADYHSSHSDEEKGYILKILHMMRFTNSISNTFTPESLQAKNEGNSACCAMDKKDCC